MCQIKNHWELIIIISVINKNSVSTLILNIFSSSSHAVRLGEYDTTQPIDCVINQGCNKEPLDILVEEAVAYETYLRMRNDQGNRYNDIGLIRLEKKVEFTGKRIYYNNPMLDNHVLIFRVYYSNMSPNTWRKIKDKWFSNYCWLGNDRSRSRLVN